MHFDFPPKKRREAEPLLKIGEKKNVVLLVAASVTTAFTSVKNGWRLFSLASHLFR